MQEKEMISDYLAGLNASLSGYGSIISQCENEELRSTIQLMRFVNMLFSKLLRKRDITYLHKKQQILKLLQLSNSFHKDNAFYIIKYYISN